MAGTYTLGEAGRRVLNALENIVYRKSWFGELLEGLGNARNGCKECPVNVVCKLGQGFVPNGFWRLNRTSYILFKCPHTLHCLGVKAPQGYVDIPYGMENIDHNESCAKGHSGVLCGQCINNYYLGMYGMCYECAPTSERIFWIVFMAFILIFGILLLRWISIGPKPKLKQIRQQLHGFRQIGGFDHACIYFSNANDKNHHLRFIEHSSKNLKLNKEERRLTRSSVVDSIFSVGVRGKQALQTKNLKQKHQHLPRKILVSKKKHSKINACFEKKIPVHIVEDEKKELLIFKDLNEFIKTNQSDLGDVRGMFMVATTNNNDGVYMGGIDQLTTVEDFVKSHNSFWASQSEDLSAILTKILLSHLQIYAAMRYIVLPLSGSTSIILSCVKELSSLFITYTLSNSCVFKSFCGF